MKILESFSLKKFNTWGLGGCAERCLQPESLQDLQEWIMENPCSNLCWLGLGSNILFKDGLLPLTIIQPRTFIRQARLEGGIYIVEAGVNCARIAKEMSRIGYRDAVFFCGIPGTIGGALRMNAGAFGGETWSHVLWVELLTPDGQIKRFEKKDFVVSYRHVDMPEGGWFVRAALKFQDQHTSSVQHLIGECLRNRMRTQPVGELTCGSVFKNPKNGYAAKYIESLGLKGLQIGHAKVSEMHANFMINVDGLCRAQDMYALIQDVKKRVFQSYGVVLELEVHCIGFDQDS